MICVGGGSLRRGLEPGRMSVPARERGRATVAPVRKASATSGLGQVFRRDKKKTPGAKPGVCLWIGGDQACSDLTPTSPSAWALMARAAAWEPAAVVK